VRIVLDTNVVISALLWGGIPMQVLETASHGSNEAYTSTAILYELRDVLSRPKLASRLVFSALTIDQLVARYLDLTTLVEPVPLPRIAPDPNDDVVIGTAAAAAADLLVTGDRTLLSVGTYLGCSIVSVQTALVEIAAR
jgi:putative PIN family toxin of toxin-antitoxin system